MDAPKTIRVKPWGGGQGDHVVINEADFNPELHTLLDGAEGEADGGQKAMSAAELKKALTEKGIEFRGNASKAALQALLDGAA